MIDITTVQGYKDFIKESKDQRFNTVLSQNSNDQSYIIDSNSHAVIATINDSVKKYLLEYSY